MPKSPFTIKGTEEHLLTDYNTRTGRAVSPIEVRMRLGNWQSQMIAYQADSENHPVTPEDLHRYFDSYDVSRQSGQLARMVTNFNQARPARLDYNCNDKEWYLSFPFDGGAHAEPDVSGLVRDFEDFMNDRATIKLDNFGNDYYNVSKSYAMCLSYENTAPGISEGITDALAGNNRSFQARLENPIGWFESLLKSYGFDLNLAFKKIERFRSAIYNNHSYASPGYPIFDSSYNRGPETLVYGCTTVIGPPDCFGMSPMYTFPQIGNYAYIMLGAVGISDSGDSTNTMDPCFYHSGTTSGGKLSEALTASALSGVDSWFVPGSACGNNSTHNANITEAVEYNDADTKDTFKWTLANNKGSLIFTTFDAPSEPWYGATTPVAGQKGTATAYETELAVVIPYGVQELLPDVSAIIKVDASATYPLDYVQLVCSKVRATTAMQVMIDRLIQLRDDPDADPKVVSDAQDALDRSEGLTDAVIMTTLYGVGRAYPTEQDFKDTAMYSNLQKGDIDMFALEVGEGTLKDGIDKLRERRAKGQQTVGYSRVQDEYMDRSSLVQIAVSSRLSEEWDIKLTRDLVDDTLIIYEGKTAEDAAYMTLSRVEAIILLSENGVITGDSTVTLTDLGVTQADLDDMSEFSEIALPTVQRKSIEFMGQTFDAVGTYDVTPDSFVDGLGYPDGRWSSSPTQARCDLAYHGFSNDPSSLVTSLLFVNTLSADQAKTV